MRKLMDQYLASHGVTGLSASTQRLYGYVLKKVVYTFCRSHHIGSPEDLATDENMEKLSAHLKRRKLTEQSVHSYITCTKMFLKWAGHPSSFRFRVSHASRKLFKKKHLRRWFTEDEVLMCLSFDWTKSRVATKARMNHLLVRLLIETGCRVRELSCIRPKDVDVLHNTVWLFDSKTEPRPAFFGPITAELFSEVLSDGSIQEDERLFPGSRHCRRIVNSMLKKLGLKTTGDGRGPHTFRHFCATRLYYEGDLSIEDLSFLLGAKTQTIVNHYLHPTSGMLKKRVFRAMRW